MVKEIGALKRIVKSKIDNYHPTVDTDRVDLRHLASYAIDSRTSAFLDDAVSFDGVNYFILLKIRMMFTCMLSIQQNLLILTR
jgi:hypothetical protein